MTNDLFRDYLGGKILTPRATRAQIRRRYMARTQVSFGLMTDALIRFGQAMSLTADQIQLMGRAFNVQPDPPADPRARALAAKEQRGTGPTPDVMRNRGRVNYYREKG